MKNKWCQISERTCGSDGEILSWQPGRGRIGLYPFGVIVASLVLSVGQAQSPSWSWRKRTEGNTSLWGSRQGTAVAVDTTGSVYDAGLLQGTAQFGAIQLIANAVAFPGLSEGEGGFLAKYDANGSVVWAVKNVGWQAFAVAVGPDGAVYATGLSPSRGTFVSKYRASDGVLIWTRNFSGIGNNAGLAIAVSANTGNVFVGGYETRAVTRVSGGAQVARWIKTDSSGNLLSATSFIGDDFSLVSGIAVDAVDSVYLAGTFKSNLPISGAATLVSGRTSNDVPTIDAFFAKIGPTGTASWTRSVSGSATDDYGRAVAVDVNGSVYAAGSLGSGHFLVQYDGNGGRKWLVSSTSAGGADRATAVASDGRGGAYWAGTFSGTFDLVFSCTD